MMEEQLSHFDNGDMAAETMQSYYGASARLREGGLLPELHRLDKEETTWVIRFMQRHLDELNAQSAEELADSDPLAVLDKLGELIMKTGMTSEQLVEEHLKEKNSYYAQLFCSADSQ